MPKSGQHYERGFLSRSPLLRELAAFARPLIDRPGWPTLDDYTAFVDAERCARAPELEAIRFAPAGQPRRRRRGRTALALEQLYDGRIALAREVPCLDASYHDLFNALVWAAFPRSKRALHARQFRALERRWQPGETRLPNRRTSEQDALAIFDEGGAVLVQGEGVTPAGECARCEPAIGAPGDALPIAVLFGHAVMEHVCFKGSAVRAAALGLSLEPSLLRTGGRALFDVIDRALAPRLADERELGSPEFDGVLSIEPPGRWSFWQDAGRPRSAGSGPLGHEARAGAGVEMLETKPTGA